MSIWDDLRDPLVLVGRIEAIESGRKEFAAYIKGHIAICDILDHVVGPQNWRERIIFEALTSHRVMVVDKEGTFDGASGTKTFLPPYEKTVWVATCVSELAIGATDEEWVSRSGTGSGDGGECDTAYKGAHTDSIKRAATMFGIGNALYKLPKMEQTKGKPAAVKAWEALLRSDSARELAAIGGGFETNVKEKEVA